MTPTAFELSLALSVAHSRLSRQVDEALGPWHGIALRELGVLVQLSRQPEGSALLDALAMALGLSPASLVRLCLPLEKTGLIERARRRVSLRAPGTRLAREAMATAEDAGARALAAASAADRVLLHRLLSTVAVPR